MITESQLKKCISEIGLLALCTSSCIETEISLYQPVSSKEISLDWFPSTKVVETAESLLLLKRVVEENWDYIVKRPLKIFSNEIGIVDLRKQISSPVSLIQSKLNPNRKRGLGFNRIESYQCAENEFLCYVIDVYLVDLANGIASILESLSFDKIVVPHIPQKLENERSDFIQELYRRIQERNNLLDAEKERITRIAKNLKECVKWSKQARKAAFLTNVITPNELPETSLRLTNSPAYGAIYYQFVNCRTYRLVNIEKVLYLYKYIYNGFIHPEFEVYKLWCVVRLYSTLVLYNQMSPPDNEPTIFEAIKVKRGHLELIENKKFTLKRYLNDNQEFRVSFWYKPQIQVNGEELIVPDIKLEILTPGDKGLNIRRLYDWYNPSSSKYEYCFNILDRDYDEQGYNQFLEDVIDTARNSYWQKLKHQASFILHTDKKINYWGEVDNRRILNEKFNVDISKTAYSEYNKYVGHRYGAIALLPDFNSTNQLKKLIQLLLKYHNSSLKTVCLACNYQLTWPDDVVPSWKPSIISEQELISRVAKGSDRAGSATGVYCSCPNCGDFWVIQLCYGNHHPLIKLIDSFHRHSDHPEWQGKWMFICPHCGSDPTYNDILASRNAGF